MGVIDIENLSKSYNISRKRGEYLVLRDKLRNVFSGSINIFKKNELRANENFWALKDVNFHIEQGEIFGVIGHNGAGKSTLLKIISQITPPTSGNIKIKGRMASLLEIGTGFHPELSGRENIFLNGVILGMTKKEIKNKLEEIIDFSGVEKFLDTPVKHYSSGMYVRLAFAVAAHMEAEIILIDEILAVGDNEFQRKCLNKINEIVAKKGRTVVIISHNLEMVRSLCNKCLLLDKGGVSTIGHPEDVIKRYVQMSNSPSDSVVLRCDRKGLGKIIIKDLRIENSSGLPEIYSGDKTRITIKYHSQAEKIGVLRISLVLYDLNNQPLVRFDNAMTGDIVSNDKKEGIVVCETGSLNFAAGNYNFNIAVWQDGNLQDFLYNALNFKIHKNNNFYGFTGNFDERTDKALIAHSFKTI